MIKIGTLIFTQEGKVQGVQYLGYLNMGRTVAATIVHLSRYYHAPVNSYEICEYINFQIEELRQKRQYPGVDTMEDRDIQDVKRSISSVVRRSATNPGKFIPTGICKIEHSDYYQFKENTHAE